MSRWTMEREVALKNTPRKHVRERPILSQRSLWKGRSSATQNSHENLEKEGNKCTSARKDMHVDDEAFKAESPTLSRNWMVPTLCHRVGRLHIDWISFEPAELTFLIPIRFHSTIQSPLARFTPKFCKFPSCFRFFPLDLIQWTKYLFGCRSHFLTISLWFQRLILEPVFQMLWLLTEVVGEKVSGWSNWEKMRAVEILLEEMKWINVSLPSLH